MRKINSIEIKFSTYPNVSSRLPDKLHDSILFVISKDGVKRSLYKDKVKFPFILRHAVKVFIFTDILDFSFTIPSEYVYNGADIPHCLEYFVGSKEDIRYLQGALVHDYLLEYKESIYSGLLSECISVAEYRRLTSLVFREVIKQAGTPVIKANIMSWAVDCFQATFNRKAWKL